MLAAAQRLRRREDFATTIRGGRRVGRGSLVVHVRSLPGSRSEKSGADDVRAGFVVSRAVGNAVVRNLVRRRLRHLVAERLPELPHGADLVVRALPAAAGRRYADLAADLDAALAALGRPGPSGRGGGPSRGGVAGRGGSSGRPTPVRAGRDAPRDAP